MATTGSQQDSSSNDGKQGFTSKAVRQILAPTDFSEHATSAVDYAAALAGRLGSDLALVKTRDLKSRADVMVSTIDDVIRADDEALLEKTEERVRPHLAEGAKLTSEALKAQAQDYIPNLARRIHADLIVMGNKGESALPKVFLGSTTARVMRATDVPVVAVPLDAEKTITKIGLAIQSDTVMSDASTALIKDLADGFDAEVVALHVGDTVSALECRPFVDHLEKVLDRSPISLLQTEKEGDIKASLQHMTYQAGIDLLCMVRGKHNVLSDLIGRSATLRAAFDCPVPLLVLQG